MPRPDDFGMSAVRTLARVADPAPAREHSVFWGHWLQEMGEAPPALVARTPGGTAAAEPDPSDETCTHAFVGYGGVRIGARLQLPPDGAPIRGGIVSTHGYGVSKPIADRDALFAPVAARGIAVLNIRVRGFAGSRLDTGDWQTPTEPGLGGITRGLDNPDPASEGTMRWSYAQGVADVFQACRAMRAWLGEHANGAPLPLDLHGESFGGGLAVPAAAKLEGRGAERARIARLVIALPTMGDWPWRHDHPIQDGSGAEIARLIERRPERADLIRLRLRLFDSVVHAGRIRCPVLCKLAERDEIVPAPSAAAVFNALRVDPGMKWRFVVPCGHAEAGLANARRHLEFERCMTDFLDPTRTPEAAMRSWADRLHVEAESAPPAPDAETGSLFGDDAESTDELESLIVERYARTGRTLDDLPYTADYEQLWSSLAKATNMGRKELFRKLHNMRKAGKMPRLGRAPGSPPAIDAGEEALLAALVTESLGSLGQRDRLPYSDAFDSILERFCAQTGRALSAHDVWRLIAKLAK